MKKLIIFLLHAVLWFFHFSLVVLILGVLFQGNEDRRLIARFWDAYFWYILFPSVLSFYLFYFLLFPRYFSKKHIGLTLVYGLIIAFTCSWITHQIILDPGLNRRLEVSKSAPGWQSWIIVFFIALASGAIALVIRGFLSWIEDMKLKASLMKKNHEMEMAQVKAQLDPHFLFNTINNIDMLIMKDAAAASDYLNKLADIMRFMFQEVGADEILLSEEIQYIKKYIDLQSIRNYNADYTLLTVAGNSNGKRVAPMTFIPFIENAFKYAEDAKSGHAITIDLWIGNDCVKFTCVNRYVAGREHGTGIRGIGNELIKKRLQLIYPEAHRLNIIKTDNTYSVYLEIEYGKI